MMVLKTWSCGCKQVMGKLLRIKICKACGTGGPKAVRRGLRRLKSLRK